MPISTDDPKNATQEDAYKKIVDALECPTPSKPLPDLRKWGLPCPDKLALSDYPGDLAGVIDGHHGACTLATQNRAIQTTGDNSAKSAGRK